MSFASPQWLWGLAVLPIWLVLALRRARRAPSATLPMPGLASIRGLVTLRSLAAPRVPLVLRMLVLALLLVALARPQSGRAGTKVRAEGIDIVLAVDTSGSMRALDLDDSANLAARRTRLAVVHDVVKKFVTGRPNDQVGLVVFGESAFTLCPLTLDHDMLQESIGRLEIGMAGNATAVGDGLGIALKRLERSKATSRIVVLLTDGRSNAGELTATQAAAMARALGVKVYTIGAASTGPAPVLMDTPFGPQVGEVKADLDEASLRQIAETTGGQFYRATDAAALEAVYAQIDRLEKTALEGTTFRDYDEHFALAGWPALGFLLLELVLASTWLRRAP